MDPALRKMVDDVRTVEDFERVQHFLTAATDKKERNMEPEVRILQPTLKPVPWRRIVLLLVLAVGIGAAAYVGINGG